MDMGVESKSKRVRKKRKRSLDALDNTSPPHQSTSPADNPLYRRYTPDELRARALVELRYLAEQSALREKSNIEQQEARKPPELVCQLEKLNAADVKPDVDSKSEEIRKKQKMSRDDSSKSTSSADYPLYRLCSPDELAEFNNLVEQHALRKKSNIEQRKARKTPNPFVVLNSQDSERKY